MSPCDLKILIVNLFQEDCGSLKCLSCGNIFCRTDLEVFVCNSGDPLFHGQFWCSFSSWYSCIMYLKGIWIPHLVSHQALLGPRLQQGRMRTNSRFPCLLAARGVVSLFLVWGEGGRVSTGQAGGMTQVVCPPLWWCWVQGVSLVTRFCFQQPVFAPGSSKVAAEFFGLCVFCPEFAQLQISAASFSPT